MASIVQLLDIELAVPDHSTLSRRARTLRLPAVPASSAGAVELLVESTGGKLCGPGEWLVEKHGAQRRRAWRKLHLGIDAGTGRIVASTLTSKEIGLTPRKSQPSRTVCPHGRFVHQRHAERLDVRLRAERGRQHITARL